MRYSSSAVTLLATFLFLSCAHNSTVSHNNVSNIGESTIWGKITSEDDNGRPITGALISLESSSLMHPRTAKTDEKGFYFFQQLPAGNDYTLMIDTAYDYPEKKVSRIMLLPWATLRLDFSLTWQLIQPLSISTPTIDFSTTSQDTLFLNDPSTGLLIPP